MTCTGCSQLPTCKSAMYITIGHPSTSRTLSLFCYLFRSSPQASFNQLNKLMHTQELLRIEQMRESIIQERMRQEIADSVTQVGNQCRVDSCAACSACRIALDTRRASLCAQLFYRCAFEAGTAGTQTAATLAPHENT